MTDPFVPPDPTGSPIEKLQIYRKKLVPLKNLEKKLKAAGVSEQNIKGLAQVLSVIQEESNYQYRQFIVELQAWANTHIHPSNVAAPELIMAVGHNSSVGVSDEGSSWTAKTAPFDAVTNVGFGVGYGNGKFVVLGSGGEILYTSDGGNTWGPRTGLPGSPALYQPAYNGTNLWVAVGTRSIGSSPDGEVWTEETNPLLATGEYLYDVAFGNGLWVVGADFNQVLTSPDGVTWTTRSCPPVDFVYAVAYADNQWVVGGGNTWAIATSPDGITWTGRTTPWVGGDVKGIAYGNGIWVAVGTSGRVATSPDGITWTAQTSGFGTDIIWNATFSEGLFIIVGSNGKIATSPDGITWTMQSGSFGTNAIRGVAAGPI